MRLTARSTAAQCLLAVLLVGGLMAPAVHVLRHAHDRAHQHAEVHDARRALQAEGEDVPTEWLVAEHFVRFECILCAVVWSSAELPQGDTQHLFLPDRPAPVLDGTSRLAAEPCHAFLVRGPPTQA